MQDLDSSKWVGYCTGMNKHDYERTVDFINSHLDDIKKHAMHVIARDDLYTSEQEELDHWDAYEDSVDLNFIRQDLDKILCFAYPVVNSVPDYSKWCEVQVLTGNEEPF